MEIANEVINPKKCYNCGKLFRTPANLLEHKNRKTPCIIREVAPEHINNPNRCIFCNKIFSKKENLTRHFTTCKVKNGGMDMLVDKVDMEQEVRLLKEDKRLRDEREKVKDRQIQELMDAVKALTNGNSPNNILPVNNVNNNVNNVNNNVINNVINNAPVVNNIVINNYNTPSIAGLSISPADIVAAPKMSKFLLETMFFNPNAPENHCMYLKNKKDKSMIIHDNGNWRSVAGDNIADVVLQLKNTIATSGSELLNGKLGPYGGNDDLFTALPGADQYKIIQFNTYKDTLTQDDLNEILLDGRNTVLGTIRASGCKLV